MPEFAEATRQKTLGQYMTPAWIAEQMCGAIERLVGDWVVLDPACGDGNLLFAAATAMAAAGVPDVDKRVVGVEIDKDLAAIARQRLSSLLQRPISTINILEADFLEWARSGVLFDDVQSPLRRGRFNVVVSNPPYGSQREYRFFEACNDIVSSGSELVFLMPLASMDRLEGPDIVPLHGRPMEVTTGHAIVHHRVGTPYTLRPTRSAQRSAKGFEVLSGVKLYEVGAGVPPQTREVVTAKRFSSSTSRPGWLPCLRTGDVTPFGVSTGRLWVNYGPHLAHPKELERFSGPRVVLRRMPLWGSGLLAAAFLNETSLSAGDLLIVKHPSDDSVLLKGLCVFLNSSDTPKRIVARRPTLAHRMSFPKFAAKDVLWVISEFAPSIDELRALAREYPEQG